MSSQEAERELSRSIRRERWLWIAATCLTLLIYSTLYFVRIPVEFLRERDLLRSSVTAVFLLAAVTVTFFLLRRRPGLRAVCVAAIFGAIYVVALTRLDRPEERLHLIEYGLLAGLVYGALVERRMRRRNFDRPSRTVFAGPIAIVLTSGLGWLDEGIQEVLPNRYYDLRDVMLNAVAAVLAVGAIASWRWAERKSS
jgi:drug/metabolite transporter (DMT)-like permease